MRHLTIFTLLIAFTLTTGCSVIGNDNSEATITYSVGEFETDGSGYVHKTKASPKSVTLINQSGKQQTIDVLSEKFSMSITRSGNFQITVTLADTAKSSANIGVFISKNKKLESFRLKVINPGQSISVSY